MKKLSAAVLNEMIDRFDYEPTRGVLIYKKSVNNALKGTEVEPTKSKTLCFYRVEYTLATVVWVLHKGELPEKRLIHLDGNPLNNRIENLVDSGHHNTRKYVNEKLWGYVDRQVNPRGRILHGFVVRLDNKVRSVHSADITERDAQALRQLYKELVLEHGDPHQAFEQVKSLVRQNSTRTPRQEEVKYGDERE